ncbi:MAG: YfhO family protein, partial [Eggerthellaceae bacterium]|nr:YfhO family protein [Eggerthellaceae bacterium]
KRAIVLVTIIVVYLAACLLLNWRYMSHKDLVAEVVLWCASVVCIAILSVWNNKVRTSRASRLANGMAVLIVCAGITLNGLMIYSVIGEDYADDFVSWSDAGELYGSEAKVINDLGDRTGFYRYSSAPGLMSRNAGMMFGQPSTSNYWSLVNAHAKEFFAEMGINGSDGGGYSWYDLNGQSTLAELLGVKYYLAEPGGLRPYGYSNDPLSAGAYYDPRDRKNKDYALYENGEPLPFGFTYSQAISPEAFEGLQPERRRELVLQACAIGEGASTVSEVPLGDGADIPTEARSVPYRIEALDGVEVQDGAYVAKKDGATARLVVDAPEGSETSLQITGLKIDVPDDDATLVCTFEYADGSSRSRSLPATLPGNQAYEPYRWFTVCPGYSAASLTSIIVIFSEKGSYCYEDLSVIAQPMGSYDHWVAALTEDAMENVDMHYLSSETAATNRVTGEITFDQPKILCTQIPYSQGWTVLVDGEKADMIQTNVMLCGVELPADHHVVEFIYETPGLFIGTLLSVAGLVGIAFLAFLDRRRE